MTQYWQQKDLPVFKDIYNISCVKWHPLPHRNHSGVFFEQGILSSLSRRRPASSLSLTKITLQVISLTAGLLLLFLLIIAGVYLVRNRWRYRYHGVCPSAGDEECLTRERVTSSPTRGAVNEACSSMYTGVSSPLLHDVTVI